MNITLQLPTRRDLYNICMYFIIIYFLFSFFYRYLATGCNFTDLHLDFKCGHTTARTIVKETVEVIWKKLKDISMPEPTEELHLKTAEGFMKHANFPNLIGAIDGKHIRIIKPCHTGSEYYNYKKKNPSCC